MVPSRGRLMTVLVLEVIAVAFSVWAAVAGVYDNTFSTALMWAIAGVMIILIGLSFSELGTMFPVTGGVIRFPMYAFGGFASYSMGWITWVAAAVVPAIETTGMLQYATKWYHFTDKHMVGGEPVHTLTPVGIVAALVLLAIFCVINAIGVKFFTQINNVLVWWKLAVIALVVVLFLVTAFHGANFTSHGFAPEGGKAMFTAISTSGITFSYLGFRQAIELAGESNDPKRNVPFAVIGSVVLCMVIYVLLQIAFIGALSGGDLAHGWSQLSFTNDFGPLAAVSTAIGLGWLATILYIDAIISPADTGLIYTTVTGRVSYAMGRNGNAPRILAKTTPRGVPLVSLFVTFVVVTWWGGRRAQRLAGLPHAQEGDHGRGRGQRGDDVGELDGDEVRARVRDAAHRRVRLADQQRGP